MDNNNKKTHKTHFDNEIVRSGAMFRSGFYIQAGGPGVGGYTLLQYL